MRSPLRFSLVFLLIILAGLCIYHRYEVHKRYENISRFDYMSKDSIDYNYYDQDLLKTYIDNCIVLSDMGKTVWLRQGIDITTAHTGYGEIQSRINRYNNLLRYTRSIEEKLTQSYDMKEQGLTNDDIKVIIDKDITIGAVESAKDKTLAFDFLKGKNISASSKKNEIWELQKLLNANDYNLSINGVFDGATDSALLDFQNSNNIYPSHICDDFTLSKLAD